MLSRTDKGDPNDYIAIAAKNNSKRSGVVKFLQNIFAKRPWMIENGRAAKTYGTVVQKIDDDTAMTQVREAKRGWREVLHTEVQVFNADNKSRFGFRKLTVERKGSEWEKAGNAASDALNQLASYKASGRKPQDALSKIAQSMDGVHKAYLGNMKTSDKLVKTTSNAAWNAGRSAYAKIGQANEELVNTVETNAGVARAEAAVNG
ncbi:hypothetical protein FRB96_000680 [Tulasnella sp. 330]|nr:hypothetical protein FRB96_000680 [Tulasnella sp. 330]